MADLPRGHHGNFPQRRATPLPRVADAMPPETGPILATEESPELSRTGLCETEKETNQSCNGDTSVTSSSEKRKRLPDKSVKDLLKRIRIYPETQKILGNSYIAVVSLERLNFQSVFLPSLQPVVSLVRLPRQTQAELHSDVSSERPQQNGFSPNEEDLSEIREGSPESEPAESADLGQTENTSWTEPLCPDSSPSAEPEQDSGFDCESNPDQTYILFDSGSEDGKSETFYLDPDAEQTLVIELDPDADQDRCLQLEDESEMNCEAAVVSELEDGEDHRADLCCSEEQADCYIQQPEAEAVKEEMESEDFCAVCLNGGDLLCCDRCPKVYHLVCHMPPLTSLPLGDWLCTLCRTDQEPAEAYDCENVHSCAGLKAPYTLSNQDQRRCEKLTLLLYCNLLSAPFHEPVSPLAQNYYQIIKRPIDLSVIRRKLDKSNTLHYFTAEQFIDDVLLMFKNCATFNYPDSEVAQAGRNLELFFLSKLKEIFPDRTFPSASQDRKDGAHLQWLSSSRRKETCRKKRYVFRGKKFYL